jgi:hypothetical protein
VRRATIHFPTACNSGRGPREQKGRAVLGVEVRVDALPVTAMVDLERVVDALREQQNAPSAEMEFIRPSQAGLGDTYKPSL